MASDASVSRGFEGVRSRPASKVAVICLIVAAQGTSIARAQGCAKMELGAVSGVCAASDLGAPPNTISSTTTPAAATAPPPPVAFTPSQGGSLSMSTSLNRLRDYNAAVEARKLEEAKALASSTLASPKSAPSPSALDVWTNLEISPVEDGAEISKRTQVGANYRISRYATAGMTVGATLADSGELPKTQDPTVSAYVALQLSPIMSIKTKTEWDGAGADVAVGASSDAVDKKSVVVAPRIGKTFSLGDKETIQPFVEFKQELELDSGASNGSADPVKMREAAAAGITLTKPEAYSLDVTTDVDGVGSGAQPNLNSKIQLKLPLH